MYFDQKVILKAVIRENWAQIVGSIAALAFIASAMLYWHYQESPISQEEAYQAAFKWSAMLSLHHVETDCQKPQAATQEALCVVRERQESGLIRRFQLSCSASIKDNGGCRLLARLP